MKIYINGSLENTDSTATVDLRTMNGDNLIGAYNSAGSTQYYLEGKIDQLRIFNKSLSSSEITSLYNETAATVESLDPLGNSTTDTLQVLGDSSCLALYKFDNNADDKSGNYNATETEIQYAAGRYDQGADFNGSTSRITYSSGMYSNNSSHSESFWVKLDSYAANEILIWSGDDNLRLNSDGTIKYRRYSLSAGSRDIDSSTALSTGQWYHIVTTYDTSSGSALYINGVSEGTNSSTANVDSTSGDYGIMHRADNNTYHSDGVADQLRIFNKALSASEVTTLYQENALVASYRFEGNSSDDTRNNDGTDSNVTYEFGLNFTPDFVWIKKRDATENHRLYDSTRGVSSSTNTLYPSLDFAASTESPNGLESFDTGGFTVSTQNAVNSDGNDFVAWCLKANGGTTSSNSDGDITSTVQSNTDAGFSIVNWTSTSTISDTIGHGLNGKPDVVLYKKLSGTSSWYFYTDVIDGSWDALSLNLTDAKSDVSGTWATSSTFKSITSVSGSNWITYCFHSVEGFSKFGSYTGNGDANGPIVETGFEPAFVMVKNTSTAGYLWLIADNKRQTSSLKTTYLQAQSNAAEYSPYTWIEFLSNGFQLKKHRKFIKRKR